jgi:predicted CxxxxCH...CXXCH cytochrome family protein
VRRSGKGHRNGAGTTSSTYPTAGHINGTLSVVGTVVDGSTVTYTGGLTGTCGTFVCHNNGKGAAPYNSGAGSYAWGTALTNCTACHNNPNATGNDGARHSKHMANATYVSGGCAECHPAATAASHIDGTKNATGAKQSLYTSANGTCTNTCHATTVANGVWTDALAPTCTNCHSGTYIGGGANNASSGLHTITPSVSGKIHDATINGSGCAACHTTVAAQATHVNGTFEGGNAQKTQMGLPAWYTQTADNTGTCATTACHLTVSDPWAHVWTNTASYYTTSPAACGGCHGDYSGWKAGTTHATNPTRGNTQHTGTGTLTYPCKDCHAIGATNAAYNFTFGSNDWKNIEAGTTQHGDGLITMNSASTTWVRSGGRSGCSACHEGATGTANAHDYAATSWTSGTLAGDAPVGGSCNSCHGYPPVQRLGVGSAGYAYASGANAGKARVEDYPGGGRAHAVVAHINPATLPDPALNDWTPCAPCHTQTDHRTGYGLSTMATTRDSSGLWSNFDPDTGRKPTVRVNPAYDKAPGTALYNMNTRNTTTGMGNCSSTSCHFSESPKWDCIPADTTNDPL